MGSMCAGSVRCWAAMLAAGHVLVDTGEQRLPLRHSHHRYEADGPNGPVKLTVALAGSTNAMPVPMSQVRISEHGNWRHLHWGALQAAYGKSPFYDYFAPELKPVIGGSQSHLLEFNTQLQQAIISFLDLPITITQGPVSQVPAGAVDLRGRIGGKRPDNLPIANVPYHQVWQQRNGGFVPGLSILDLLMNQGREAIFTLLDMLPLGLDGLRQWQQAASQPR